MKRFKCNACGQVYRDSYPVDDTCKVCKRGLIRITEEYITIPPFSIIIDGEVVKLGVIRSNAGYYLGYFSYNDGPIDRITGYMDKKDVEALLERIMEDERIHTLWGIEGDEYKREAI